MKNKTVLISGATDGIGKQTAIELLKLGARIIVHGRTIESCKKTVAEISKISARSEIEIAAADLSSLAEVKKMALDLNERFENLDVLINNAGVYENVKILTKDGYEKIFAINHLSHFLLTNLLLELLKSSAPSRIINVSSVAHQNCEFDLENLNSEKYFDPYNAYAISKAANVLFTYKLAEDLKNSKITVNALHPGVISTKLLHKGFGIQGSSLKSGAETSVYLATSSNVENITGKYFVDSTERPSTAITYDKELQKKFWNISQDMIAKFL